VKQIGVKFIRTLKIIKLMKETNVITTKEAIHTCTKLKENNNTRNFLC